MRHGFYFMGGNIYYYGKKLEILTFFGWEESCLSKKLFKKLKPEYIGE